MADFNADQYYQQILDAKRKASSNGFDKLSQAQKNAVYNQSNSARDILKQNNIDTSTGYWASGTDYNTANQGYTQDKLKNQVNSMYDNLQSSRLNQLKASQQEATNKLNQQKAEYGQQIHGQKNQADVTSMQNAQKLKEMMASNGLLKSGENVAANVANNSARQGALNALDQQQNNYNRDVADQISAINDPSKQQAIIDDLNAQRAQALLNAQQTAYNQAMGQEQFDANQANTAWNQNFQQSQADQSQQNWQSQFDYGKQQDAAQQAWQKYTYDNMSAAQKAQFDQNASQFGQQMAWNLWNAQYQGTMQQAALNAQLNSFNNPSEGGGDYTNYKMMPQAQKSPNYRTFSTNLDKAMQETGAPESWYTPIAELVGRESSWNANAKNPSSSAHGYAQFLDSTVKNYSKYGDYSNPTDQLVMMMHYIKDRYGTPQKALAFWDAHHYY